MTRPQTRNQVVSSEDERLILVDSNDRELGTSPKSDCHDGDGVLHRAFSLFVFNADGALLIHQRQADKRLWPLYWSNSCCSHPRAGEDMELAVSRRLEQELGLRANLRFMYKFEYAAAFGDVGSEHELCWVYAGTTTRGAGREHDRGRRVALDCAGRARRRTRRNTRALHAVVQARMAGAARDLSRAPRAGHPSLVPLFDPQVRCIRRRRRRRVVGIDEQRARRRQLEVDRVEVDRRFDVR